jgi:hypothetical protein
MKTKLAMIAIGSVVLFIGTWFFVAVPYIMKEFISRPSAFLFNLAVISGGARQKIDRLPPIIAWANVKTFIHPPNAELLVKFGADINATDEKGYNAGMISPHVPDKLEILLRLRLNPNYSAPDGLTILEVMMIEPQLEKAEKEYYIKNISLLLTYNANPCLVTRESKGKRTVYDLSNALKLQGKPEFFTLFEKKHKACEEEPKKMSNLIKMSLSQIGSTEWAFSKAKGIYPANTNKCNLFVDDMLRPEGLAPPFVERGMLYTLRDKVTGGNRASHPVLAGQWADEKREITGWKRVGNPQIGDIAAYAFDYGNASGHVGIVTSLNGGVRITSHLPQTQTVIETDVKTFMNGENHVMVYRRYMK